MSEKQLAVMKNVRFGVDDRDRVCLRFSAYISESQAADLSILAPHTQQGDLGYVEFVGAYRVDDVAKLNGRPVWVRREGPDVTLVGPWKF